MRVLLCHRPVSCKSHPNLSVKRSRGLRERDLPQTLLTAFIRRIRRSEERNLLMERVYYSEACLEMRINNSERNRCSSSWSRRLHFSLSKNFLQNPIQLSPHSSKTAETMYRSTHKQRQNSEHSRARLPSANNQTRYQSSTHRQFVRDCNCRRGTDRLSTPS
jgi:hypothetical protein